MGSTSYLNKSKAGEIRARSGSSVASDKDYFGKLRRRPKIRRPGKVGEFGGKRVPDYTELAYKEAVSKLRYFLTGNYSSSVRSYGCSPSIKDLDDLDGGLEKKSSTALLQYRPRPRLSAKYATLYADSLNNYGSGNVTGGGSPAAATSEPAAAGTSPDVITFIQKQEEYIEQLERESQYCREELNNLLGKVKEVISENEHLHEAQKDKIITKMFHTHSHCPTGSETDDLDDAGDSTGRDTDAKLSSKSRRMKPRTRLEGPSIVFESRISELEAQLAQAKIDLKKVQDENNENKRKLVSGLADNTCLDGYKRQIENLQRDKTALENQISKLKSSLIDREDDLRHKRDDVTEHRLRDEIATLEGELRALKEELSNERSRVRELAGEGARRAAQERSAAELRHSAHCDQLAGDLAAQYDHVAKLQLELDRQRREESDLKRELAMRSNAIEDLKMELKNKSGTLQADLAQALAEKASVEEELSSARLSLERQIRQSKHEANRLNSEIQSVRQRLDRADADLVLARRENLRLSEKIASLETELKMKNLTPTSPEKKKEKEMSSLLESIENKHAKTVSELESMIHSQNTLMEKLTDECRSLTTKLDDANLRHKEELATLQRQVETIGRNMQPHPPPDPYYQAPPTHTSPAHRDVDPPATARREHPSSDAPRLPDKPTFSRIGADHHNSEDRTPISRQHSRQSVRDITPIEQEKEVEETKLEDVAATDNAMDVEQINYEQNYDQSNYDQNYQQGYETEGAEYQNFEQQPQYEGDYQQNYEQYDPNAQYEGQYETQDPIYQNVQEYSSDQVYNQEDTATEDNLGQSATNISSTENDIVTEESQKDTNESKTNNSPSLKPNKS